VALKRNLTARHCNDREAYTAAKEDFVREILALAKCTDSSNR
jgi:GrpB-like predicted nucleotidyltransferase (UPF0157 family)